MLDLIRANMDADLPFAGLTGLTIASALGAAKTATINGSANIVNLRLTPAQYRQISPSLAVGNSIKIKAGATTYLDTTITRFEEFDESAANDDLAISVDSATTPGSLPVHDADLEIGDADASLWNSYVDGRAEANFDAKVEGEKFEASDGFEFVGSGSDLQPGKVWVETGAGADDMKTRARDADGADTLAGKIHAGTLLLYGDIAASYALIKIASVGAVTGSGASRVFSFTFSDHRAVGTLTGDQPLRIFPDLPSALKDIIAPRSVPPWALDPGNGTAGQVLGVTSGGDIGLVADRHVVTKAVTKSDTTTQEVANYSTFTQYPNIGETDGGTQSTDDLVFQPLEAGDKVDLMWSAIAEFVTTGRGLDVRIDRKIGSGNWTQIYTKDFAVWTGGEDPQINVGNPTQLVVYTDSPNTTDEVRYRIMFRQRQVGQRVGNQRFRGDLIPA